MQRGEGILDLQLFATRGKGCGWGLQQPDHFSSSYKALNHPNFPVSWTTMHPHCQKVK